MAVLRLEAERGTGPDEAPRCFSEVNGRARRDGQAHRDGHVFLSCGEVSGDGYAAALVRALRGRGFSGSIFGMAGEKGAAEGVEILWNSRSLHLMGIAEVVPAIPRLLRLRRDMVDTVLRTEPSTVVVIDSPDFHLPFLAALRSKGWRGRVVYAIPPTVWAWREGRVRFLKRDVDLCLPLFRFEHDFLLARGVPSAWEGHPLLSDGPGAPVEPDGRRIALLPGSRGSEIRRLLPPLKECARLLKGEGFSPVFSIAPGIGNDLVHWMKQELQGEELWEKSGAELLASSAAAAGASGTVAVEAMMQDRFMVVLYKSGMLSELVWKMLGRTNLVSLPNILAGREIYPEFLQRAVSGRRTFDCLMRYLRSPEYRASVHEGLAGARDGMGRPGAVEFWADAVLSPLEELPAEDGDRARPAPRGR